MSDHPPSPRRRNSGSARSSSTGGGQSVQKPRMKPVKVKMVSYHNEQDEDDRDAEGGLAKRSKKRADTAMGPPGPLNIDTAVGEGLGGGDGDRKTFMRRWTFYPGAEKAVPLGKKADAISETEKTKIAKMMRNAKSRDPSGKRNRTTCQLAHYQKISHHQLPSLQKNLSSSTNFVEKAIWLAEPAGVPRRASGRASCENFQRPHATKATTSLSAMMVHTGGAKLPPDPENKVFNNRRRQFYFRHPLFSSAD